MVGQSISFNTLLLSSSPDEAPVPNVASGPLAPVTTNWWRLDKNIVDTDPVCFNGNNT